MTENITSTLNNTTYDIIANKIKKHLYEIEIEFIDENLG